MKKIKEIICQHGARVVYDAACGRIGGDKQPLLALGVAESDLATLGVAHELMSAAYRLLSRQDKAREYWAANQATNCPASGPR